MMYVHSMQSISRAQSIGERISDSANAKLKGEKTALYPDYGEYIPAGVRRRMSIGARMGVTCAKALSEIETPDAVIIGTGMGCIIQSIAFLNNIKDFPSAVSPTAFIQSTHNTVAGQIAINMGITGYNMTFSHGGFSFESALQDAMLLCEEGQTVLVGGVEEYSEAFGDFESMGDCDLSEGATFFFVSNKKEGAMVKLDRIDQLSCKPGEEVEASNGYANSIGLPPPQLILKGYSIPPESGTENEHLYSNICGIYMSNAAFGLHLATELINATQPEFGGQTWESLERIAVVNRFNDHNCGLVIISKP